jgi:hypothetical protein
MTVRTYTIYGVDGIQALLLTLGLALQEVRSLLAKHGAHVDPSDIDELEPLSLRGSRK